MFLYLGIIPCSAQGTIGMLEMIPGFAMCRAGDCIIALTPFFFPFWFGFCPHPVVLRADLITAVWTSGTTGHARDCTLVSPVQSALYTLARDLPFF